MKDFDKEYDTAQDSGSDKVRPIIATPVSDWQPFSGFSYLFDNPGGEGVEETEACLLSSVNILSNPDLKLYKQIANTVNWMDLNEITKNFHFFALPNNTYHVTLWDGVNTGNISGLDKKAQLEFDKCFLNEKTILQNWPPLIKSNNFSDYFPKISPIRFKYKNLRCRSNTVLVVDLDPADSESEATLNKLLKKREDLDNMFETLNKPRNSDYRPHIAVGYFADTGLSQSALYTHMDNWMSLFDQELRGATIEFNSISLYAFTDMITYFKPSK